jgi:glycogen synthase
MAGILCEHHPGDLVSIHACVAGVSYGFAKHWGTISVRVEEDELSCTVLSYAPEQSANKTKVLFLFVDHDIFRKRPGGFHSAGKAETVIYANPSTSREALRFYSAWNQAVAVLVDKLRPDLFHCPDYHSSMSVAYFKRAVPTVLMLHNAEYQGSIETQQFGPKDINFVSSIFNLSEEIVKGQVMADGCFNMLRPMICYLEKNQRGHGICTVSKNYALEIQQRYPFFWRLPAIQGIDNPFPDNERVVLPGASEQDFLHAREQAKLRIQREYGLIEDTPVRKSRIFVFLGRWVKQKGVDYIANITTKTLSEHSDAQLIMIGPVGDSFGSYAVKKLQSIVDSGAFKGRLYVHSGFLKVPPELKLACDFCLMPSRDEPFGFVDLEFGAAGAATVGSLRGGLGKTPGFFYRTVNAESGKHVEACFSRAVQRAMACPPDDLKRMSVACWRQASGPSFRVEGWRNELGQAYVNATNSFRGRLPNMDSWISKGSTRNSSMGQLSSWDSSSLIQAVPELPSRPPPRAPNNDTASLMEEAVCEMNERQDGEPLVQEADEHMLQRLMEANVAVAALTKAKEQSAQTMLAEIKWSLKLASEPSRITQLLGQSIGGLLGVDVLICGSYLLGPVLCVCLFELGQSMRASDAPLILLSDAPWAALVQILGVLAWTGAATRVRPHHLMSVAILIRALLLPLGAMLLPASVVTALYGIITAGDYALLFFAFMAAATGDIGKLAVQTGCLMTLRTTCFRLVTPLVHAMNSSLAWRLPVLTVVVVFSLVPGVALYWAPQSYTEFRLPDMKGQLLSLSRRKVPMLMGFAQVTEAFATVYAAAWVNRRLKEWSWNAFISEPILRLNFFTVLALLSPLLVLVAASCRPGGVIFLIKGFAFFSISCVGLQASIDVSVAGTGLWEGFEVVFVVVAALSQISQHAVVLATIGSRWRFIVYICVVAVFSLVAQSLALVLIPMRASQGWLVIPLICATAIGGFCRLCAAAFFSSEATGILRTRRERKLILEVDAAASRAHRIQEGCQV